MGPPISEQLAVFAGTLLLGGVIGVLSDLSDGLCRAGRGLLRALLDGMFCLSAAGLILLFLLIHTQGILRWYLVLGGLLGFGAEHTCLSPCLRRGMAWLFPRLAGLLRRAWRGFVWLFTFPRGQ